MKREDLQQTTFFFLKCYQKHLLQEIYTTNFDLLTEKAFLAGKTELLVYRNEESFTQIDLSGEVCKLIKVHGSIDDKESIRTTLTSITNQSLSKERGKVIDRIFAKKTDVKILFLGYSCSDVFDIIPRIEKVFKPQIDIYLIEHDNSLHTKEKAIIQSIGSKQKENPFKNYSGQRIRVNTDSFIKWMWNKIDSDYNYTNNRTEEWKHEITSWINNFNSPYLKYTIIGQLFYRISDYCTALKYHEKAVGALGEADIRYKGASYSNIGLIYHDLQDFHKAIINFDIALQIFSSIDFYFGVAAALTNLGYSYIYLGDKIKAVKYFKKSLNISRHKDFKERKLCESDTLCNLGDLYRQTGKYSDSIYYYSLALEIDKQGNKAGEAQTLSDMGQVYRLMGKMSVSLKMFTMANEIALKTGLRSLLSFTNEQLKEVRKRLSG